MPYGFSRANGEKRRQFLEDHQRLLTASRVERFAYADALARDRDQLRLAIETWQSLWRDLLLRTSQASIPLANLDQNAEIDRLSSALEKGTPYGMLAALQRTQELVDRNVNPRMALEVLFLDLPHLEAIPG
jgi:hypothetical protein